MTGKDLSPYSADPAMFRAATMPPEAVQGGAVHLIGMTPDPLGHIASAAMMYEGRVVRDLSEITRAERIHYFEEIKKTKLKAPFEFVDLHFLLEGVTRSFTHQAVRQRTAVFAQESLRFAVKETLDEEVQLPPSLAALPADSPYRQVWQNTINKIDDAAHLLIDAGFPAEDVRGLYPHNITTRMHYATDLRALQDHAGNRLCTQAQFEWRQIWARIRHAIRTYDPYEAQIKSLRMVNHGQQTEAELVLLNLGESERWQYEAIADLFMPVCYLTGKCEFKADFDRKCSIRDRVDMNARHGTPSTEWGEDHAASAPREPTTDAEAVMIPGISPSEWLMDPGAAR